MTESVDDVFVRASGLRTRLHELRPEKPWLHTIGRGFDSRRLHFFLTRVAMLFCHSVAARVFVMPGWSRPGGAVVWLRSGVMAVALSQVDHSNPPFRGGIHGSVLYTSRIHEYRHGLTWRPRKRAAQP